MKRFMSLLLFFSMVLSVNVTIFADEEIKVVLDGSYIEFDVRPQSINDRTMVPIRAIFEKMGANVQWDGRTNSAICTKDNTVVKMTVGSTDIYINDERQSMDVSPVVIDGRTLAPARYVAEAFEADVQWSQANNTVVICSKDVYAYADYPDVPDLGKCYGIPLQNEIVGDGFKTLVYSYSDFVDDEHYSYLYDNSATVLGGYKDEIVEATANSALVSYTKRGEYEPRYYIQSEYDNGAGFLKVLIPVDKTSAELENTVTLYSYDGRTIDVMESEVSAYKNVGWYETLSETQQTLYAPDGRTITVFKSEVPAYKNVGWYETLSETQQTLYAPDGRTISVYKSEVPAYKNVGWYESQAAAQAVNKPASGSVGKQSNYATAQGPTVYVGNTGNKYHRKGCRTLKGGGIPISLEEAIAEGRTACKVCY